jgi:hypothetical protein
MEMYFEFSNGNETLYFKTNNLYSDLLTTDRRLLSSTKNITVSQYANRIWAEYDNKVIFAKNRMYGTDVKVDLKEFVWIKLRCKDLEADSKLTADSIIKELWPPTRELQI